MMKIALGKKSGRAAVWKIRLSVTKTLGELLESLDNEVVLKDLRVTKMLRCRVRYFTDGAVIGSQKFMSKAFVKSRDRFGAKRKFGARQMKGAASSANGILWCFRDFRKDVV